jgi:hypothetical protein
MSQHDYDIANQAGSAFRSDLNTALAAIVSQNSGATAPATTYAYQWWADTTTGILKQRNAANSAWISIMTLSTGLPVGALALSGGTMTGAIKNTASQIGTSGTATNNFSLEPTTTGSMKLARGDAGATSQDILSIDSSGKLTFNQGIVGVVQGLAANGSGSITLPTSLGGFTVKWGTSSVTLNVNLKATITYPAAFATYTPIALAQTGDGTPLLVGTTEADRTLSSFVVHLPAGSNGSTYRVNWIALGF